MQPGDVVAGRYEVVGRLASGGMAEVFVADLLAARGVRRRVALKRIHPHLTEDPSFARMFLDEAKLASELRHPALVPVIDAAEDAGELVLVLDYVAGWDLGAVLRRARESARAVPVGVVVSIGESLASALAYVHELRGADGAERGIVHRDVTPSNVLVADDGSVRLLDFGVAKAAERSTHTVTAALKGKIGYMAPEQALGARVDARTDLYALGLVLFEMLAGRRALSAEGDIALLEEARRPTPAPIGAARPEVPAALARLIDGLREVDPSARPASARIVAEALGAIRASTDAADTAAVRAFVELVMGSSSRPIQRAARPRSEGRSRLDEALAIAAGLAEPATGGAQSAATAITAVAATTSKESTERLRADAQPIVASPSLEPGGSRGIVSDAVVRERGHSGATSGRTLHVTELAEVPGRRDARWAWAVAAVLLVGALAVSGWLVSVAVNAVRPSRATVQSVTEPESRDVARVGFVRIATDPPGAMLRVDGRAVDETTPTVLQLEPGRHRLDLALGDHVSATSSVNVVRGATASVRVPLARSLARLVVRSEPAGATVEIDGRGVGTTPLSLPGLARRDVSVRIAAPGYAAHTEAAPFASTAEHAIDVVLARRAAFGMLDVSSAPWARVTIGGRTVADSTPALGLRLPIGRHLVVLTNPTLGWSERRTVTIREGERASLVVRRATPNDPP